MYYYTYYCRSNAVTINGVSYQKNDVVIVKFDHDDEPIFGIIQHFLSTTEMETLITLTSLETIGYSSHYHSYMVHVQSSPSTIITTFAELGDYHPLALSLNYETTNQTQYTHYIVLKYHVFLH